MHIQLVPAPLHVANALLKRRSYVQSVFQEWLEAAVIHTGEMESRPRSKEVATLCHLFLSLTGLQNALEEELHQEGVNVTIKGVFCHKSGSLGPVVDFAPTRSPGCELADILFIVTYGSPRVPGPFGNAVFFQAKNLRSDLFKGKSSKRQCQLYREARSFRFRSPDKYASSGLPDHRIKGYREMPGIGTTAFCFWEFEQRTAPREGWTWEWQASAITKPLFLNDQTQDIPFDEALFNFLMGNLGLSIGPVVPKDFGWNRIVHDVIYRAAKEPLGDTQGIVASSRIPRDLDYYIGGHLDAIVRSGVALVCNPFSEFFSWFNSSGLKKVAQMHEERSPEDENLLVQLLETFGRKGDSEEPPEERLPKPEDDGSSGSFIHIDLRHGE